MRKTTVFCITALVAIAFIALGTSGDSYADKKRVRKTDRKVVKGITLSGSFSGALKGQISIGGHKVVITKTTTLRSTTSGQLRLGQRVVSKPIYVNATLDRYGQLRATMVIVNDSPRRTGGELEELSSDASR